MRKSNKNYRDNKGVLEKQCSICLDWFPCTLEYFYENKSNKTDGLFPYCKKCSSDKVTEKYRIDPEPYKKTAKRQHSNSPEYFAKKHQRYWRNNKEKESKRAKEFRENNPDKVSEYNKKRQLKNHKITASEWIACKEYFENCCAYCGLSLEQHYKKYNGEMRLYDFHKEHVIDDGANDLSNCVPSCSSCNSSKWKYVFDDWYNEGNPIFIVERYNRIVDWISNDYLKYIEE